MLHTKTLVKARPNFARESARILGAIVGTKYPALALLMRSIPTLRTVNCSLCNAGMCTIEGNTGVIVATALLRAL